MEAAPSNGHVTLRRRLIGLAWCVVGLAFSTGLAWLSVKLVVGAGQVRFPVAGDYIFDADAPLLRGVSDGPFAIYGTDPAPLMLPLSLLLRLPVLWLAHELGLISLQLPHDGRE